MNKAVYTVVEGEDNYGISSFDIFDSEDKALGRAISLMVTLAHSEREWVEEKLEGAIANWRMGCDYITVFKKEVK